MTFSPSPIAFAAAVALVLAGCTFDEGRGFATLESATLDARFEPGEARDLGGGKVLTDLGYQVQIDGALLEIDELSLDELQGGSSAGGRFDPSHPPPGYGLCHNGHCHADDGRLVPYAEIEAELAGGAAKFVPVVTLPVERALDLVATARVALGRVEPSRELPKGRIVRLRAALSRFELRGSVSAGPPSGGLGPTVATLTIDVSRLDPLDGGFELVIDRDTPGAFGLAVTISVGGTLFDGIDFATLASAGAVTVDDTPSAALSTLTTSLSESELTVRVTQ